MRPVAAPGKFEIAREPADISFERFYRDYFLPEKPVLIEGLARDWPAREKWTAGYLKEVLSRDPSAKVWELWYIGPRGMLGQDFDEPEIISRLYADRDCHPYERNVRVWVHRAGNLSVWHYDGTESVFNLHVTGEKQWYLVSPQTPLPFYPFTGFARLGEGEDHVRGTSYTVVTARAGDLLYLPPLWTHQVLSLKEENINLTWAFTKKATDIVSPAFERESSRYHFDQYFSRHPIRLVSYIYDWLFARFPGYVRIHYHHKEFVASPLVRRRFDSFRWMLEEFAKFPRVIRDAGRIRATLNEKRPPAGLQS